MVVVFPVVLTVVLVLPSVTIDCVTACCASADTHNRKLSPKAMICDAMRFIVILQDCLPPKPRSERPANSSRQPAHTRARAALAMPSTDTTPQIVPCEKL